MRQVLGRDVSFDDSNVREAVEDITGEKIKEVVNDAPEELDTLGEVADAIKTNSDSISEINNNINNIEIKLAGMEAGGMGGDDWETMSNFDIQSAVDSMFN